MEFNFGISFVFNGSELNVLLQKNMNSWEYGNFAAGCTETCKNYLNNSMATCIGMIQHKYIF